MLTGEEVYLTAGAPAVLNDSNRTRVVVGVRGEKDSEKQKKEIFLVGGREEGRVPLAS